jgi:predicted HAD superfamily hydrolase
MVFSLLACELGNDNPAFVADFVQRRKQAECDARLALQKEAVTIDEIYDFCDLAAIDQRKNTVIDLEMSIEERMLYPVHDVLERIDNLHRAGHEIIYISDMYLPSAFLEKILSKWGFWKSGDKLFVSGECACTKLSGNLYRYVSQHLNIPFKSWHHFGDNVHGDYKIPKRLGITAHLIKNSYSRYEKKWLENADMSFDPEMCRYFAGVGRTIRLSNKPDTRTDIAANVIAPVYIPFVFHVLNDAKKRGIRHLYFTARDSYIFYRIALGISHLFPEINLFYIYLSRKALWLPSLYNCNKDEFSDAGIEGKTPKNILSMFHLSVCDIDSIIDMPPEFWNKPLNQNRISGFYNILLHEKVKEMILKRSSEARTVLLSYLHQYQLPENAEHSALVDLGWKGTSRNALNKLLLKEGYKDIYVYYWGIDANRLLYASKSRYDTFIYLNDINIMTPNSLTVMIMEHYFSQTGDSSTIGYRNNGNEIEPVFEDKSIDLGDNKAHEVNMKIMQKTVDLLLHLPDVTTRIQYCFDICALSSMKTFLQNPTYNEAKKLKDITFDDPLEGKYHQPLIRPLNIREIILLFFGPGNNDFWKLGSLVMLSPLYGRLLSFLYRKKLSRKYTVKKIKIFVRK